MSDITYGSIVEHKMNTDVFGIVTGVAGSIITVCLSPELDIVDFQKCELRIVDGEDEYVEPAASAGAVVVADEPVTDNVIDFTRARKLRANTPTKGVA